jgi:hypothetical protein
MLRRYAMAALLLVLPLAGCEEMIRNWPPQLNFTPPPNPYASGSYSQKAPSSAPRDSQASKKKEKAARNKARKRAAKKTSGTHAPKSSKATAPPEESGAGAQPQSGQASEAPKISLVGTDEYKARAQKLIQETNFKLAAIERSKLDAHQAALYEQARQLTDAGERALESQDYLTASGLAEKASVLAGKIGASSAR